MDELYECYFSSGGAPTTSEKPDRGELVASRRVSSRLCALRAPFASQRVATNQEPSDARASITKAIGEMFGCKPPAVTDAIMGGGRGLSGLLVNTRVFNRFPKKRVELRYTRCLKQQGELVALFESGLRSQYWRCKFLARFEKSTPVPNLREFKLLRRLHRVTLGELQAVVDRDAVQEDPFKGLENGMSPGSCRSTGRSTSRSTRAQSHG